MTPEEYAMTAMSEITDEPVLSFERIEACVTKMIKAAVEEEREACAQIAEKAGSIWSGQYILVDDVAIEIVEEIRARGEE